MLTVHLGKDTPAVLHGSVGIRSPRLDGFHFHRISASVRVYESDALTVAGTCRHIYIYIYAAPPPVPRFGLGSDVL